MTKFRNVAHPYVTQMSLRDKARHLVVNKNRFLCFVENGKGRTPVLFDRTPQGVKLTVDYSAEYDYPLTALADPPAILTALKLQDDSNQAFTKTCAVVAATWQAAAPEATAADLCIASRKYGYGSTDNSAAPIVWWQPRGQERQTPPCPCSLVDPAIQKRLQDYELIGTEAREFEIVRRYRRLDVLAIARAAGATHRDRQGNFYYKDRATNLVYVGRFENGSIGWRQDYHAHIPDTTERLS